MFDTNTVLATLGLAVIALSSLTLVLSRIIPDEYDQRASIRNRVESRRGR
jgi:hypothetical protein